MHHSRVIFCLRALFASLIAAGWAYQIVFVQVIVVGIILFVAYFAERILYGAYLAGSMAGFARVLVSQKMPAGEDDAVEKEWFLAMSETPKLQAVFLTYDIPLALLMTYFGSGGWAALYLGAATVLHILLKTVRGQFETSH